MIITLIGGWVLYSTDSGSNVHYSNQTELLGIGTRFFSIEPTEIVGRYDNSRHVNHSVLSHHYNCWNMLMLSHIEKITIHAIHT